MKKRFDCFSLLSLLFVILTACASIGSPKGGPKDTTPPKLMGSFPLQNALGFNEKRIEIKFDELITLKSPSEKVLVSPPQIKQPEVKTIANRAVVILADTLIPNTTYTIDFTDAIVDFNEGNKFGDYALSFSTGDYIDSLRVSGIVIDASNLNPLNGILVGTHTVLTNDIFQKSPFERISKSNPQGLFALKGLPNSNFSVFGLEDKNRDYIFDQPGERIAFMDSIVMPYFEPCTRADTVWKDTASIDTILIRSINCFKPDNLILRCFKEDFGRQFLARKERNQRSRIQLTFGTKSSTLPNLELLNQSMNNWYVLEENQTKDTLTYWILDSTLIAMDTIKLTLDYFKSDSLNLLQPTTDTLTMISRSLKSKQKSVIGPNTKGESVSTTQTPVVHLELKSNIRNVMNKNAILTFDFAEPIKEIHGMPWHLFVKKDTVWEPINFNISKDSLKLRWYNLNYEWDFEAEYKFVLDSGMVESIYGLTNKTVSQTFSIRAESEYSRLIVSVFGIEGDGFVELLNRSDEVVRSLPIVKNHVDFKFLDPGTYYLRAIEDRNGNGKWDTGNYAKRIQPEQVFYNSKSFKLRENWDLEESWNVKELPLLEQKPKELLPKESKQQR